MKSTLIQLKRLKIIILLVVLCLSTSNAIAGNLFERELTFGAKGTLSFGRLLSSDSDHGNFKKEMTPAIGVFALLKIHHNLNVQLELLWQTSKWNREYSQILLGDEIRFRETGTINYLSIPLIFKLPFPSQSSSSFAIYFGSSLRFALSGSLKGSYLVPSGSPLANSNYNMDLSNYRSIDGGFIGGLDYQFTMGKKRVLIDLRYTRGLTGTFNDVSVPIDFTNNELPYSDHFSGKQFDLKNAAIAISIGLLL